MFPAFVVFGVCVCVCVCGVAGGGGGGGDCLIVVALHQESRLEDISQLTARRRDTCVLSSVEDSGMLAGGKRLLL